MLNNGTFYFAKKYFNMKKLFFLTMLFAAFATTATFAQNGPGGGMTPEQRAERMKQMKTELMAKAKISDAEADKVMQIQQEARQGLMRGMRDLTPEERQKKMDEMKADVTKKFKAIPLTDDQVKGVNAYYDEQMQRMRDRMNRQGGGQQ